MSNEMQADKTSESAPPKKRNAGRRITLQPKSMEADISNAIKAGKQVLTEDEGMHIVDLQDAAKWAKIMPVTRYMITISLGVSVMARALSTHTITS